MLFRDIPGYAGIKKRLLGTVADGRVSHAQLFLGPEGNGKFALALAYARYVNCRDRNDSDACGTCPSCVKFNTLAHPDLHFIYPVASTSEFKDPRSRDFIPQWRSYILESNYYPALNEWYERIGIEKKQGIINAKDCNEIIRLLSYKSYESEYKIMIIWMAERLYYSAAPKILKILEEPPDKTLFILISEDQDEIINTILSRTQIVKIPRFEDKDLQELLTRQTQHTEEDIRRAAMASGGNLHSAKSFLEATEREKFNFETFRNWMRLCFKKDIIGIEGFVGEVARSTREELKSLFRYALMVSRNSLLIHYNQNKNVFLPPEEMDFNVKIAPFLQPAVLERFVGIFEEGHNHIERNAYAPLTLMDMSLRIMELFRETSQ
ncbi:MAG: DNA polymerase III subunit delta [Bacteroidetes bacterium]|nr:DNA polymerase III subunit delta [Bacteroidota bacterium]